MAKEVTIPAQCLDFANVFLEESANVLSEHIGVNKYAIELEKSKQPLSRSIYSLGPFEFEIFKTYIESNLANRFIRASKSPADSPILFVRKPNGSFYLCVNY